MEEILLRKKILDDKLGLRSTLPQDKLSKESN